VRHQGVDQAAFVDFYQADRARCLRAIVAHGLSRDEAEEAVAEAFARAWASWARVSSLQSPAAWVVRTALNANVSWWRKRRRELPAASGEAGSQHGLLKEPTYDVDLLRAIAKLPPRQREVVVLRYLLDLDTDTTARNLAIAPGTVKASLHHALASLREHLGQHQEEALR
jgi:RNA polymerase sigma factor (sigma-70 family)